jgi:hypothetical protein
MCGSDEPHPYPERSFTYRTEQAGANEVQRVIVYKSINQVIVNNLNNGHNYT